MADLFSNQTFKVYHSNQSINFTEEHLEFISLNLSKYLFENYLSENNDLIAQYSNHEEMQRQIRIETKSNEELLVYSQNQFNISYISLTSKLFPRQLFIFINKQTDAKTFSTIILSRLTNANTVGTAGTLSVNQVILSLFHELPDLSIPLIVKPGQIKNIEQIVNNLIHNFQDKHSDILNEDFHLVYGKDHQDINKNLRNITIKIPSSDLQSLILKQDRDSLIIDSINEFLYNNTKMKFSNLSIVRFTSGVLNIASEGKFKIFGAKLSQLEERMQHESIWLLIESIFIV